MQGRVGLGGLRACGRMLATLAQGSTLVRACFFPKAARTAGGEGPMNSRSHSVEHTTALRIVPGTNGPGGRAPGIDPVEFARKLGRTVCGRTAGTAAGPRNGGAPCCDSGAVCSPPARSCRSRGADGCQCHRLLPAIERDLQIQSPNSRASTDPLNQYPQLQRTRSSSVQMPLQGASRRLQLECP
jgi:hypothetical protein